MGTKKKNKRRDAVPNKRKIDNRVRIKLVALFVVVILAFLILALRVIYIGAANGENYERQVLRQNQQSRESSMLPAKRGDITDRNGTVLATSEKVYHVILDCLVVNTTVEVDGVETQPYLEPTVQALVELLGRDEEEIRSKLTSDDTKSSQYQQIGDVITVTERQAFENYVDEYDEISSGDLTDEEKAEKERRSNIKGVWFEDTYQRLYPLDSQACDLIGFTYTNGTADWGLEGYYSDVLDGTAGRVYSYYSTGDTLEQEIIDPVDGNNVVSTIDVNIQKIIRSKIEEFNTQMAAGDSGQAAEGSDQQKGAENVGVIIMNPNNGEILGMDSTDWYDLNHPRDLTQFYTAEEIQDMVEYEKENAEKAANGEETSDYDEETGRHTQLYALNQLWRNFCISDTFEPGSTAKPMNIAAALETGAITEDDTFVCDGFEYVGGYQIKCSVYPEAHGTETAADALKNSCNDALMQIAVKMGSVNFRKYQTLFGFGAKTGIDLPGEAAGVLFSDEYWDDTALATSSFGQGYNVTMIQQIAAFCSVINGGYYYQPHVVSEITDSNGAVVEKIEPKLLKQVISTDVSDTLRGYLGTAVEEGTGQSAKVEGYTMGGKTGTAEKVDPETGTRNKTDYLVSFIGFAPLDDPQVAIYVVVDRPHAENQANSVYAQELAKNILTEVLPYLGLYPDDGTDDTGEASETGARNDALPAPEESEEDETVENGGNDRYSDGMTNEDAEISGD